MVRMDWGKKESDLSEDDLRRVVVEQVQFSLGILMPANWDVAVKQFDYGHKISVTFRMFLMGCEVRQDTVTSEQVPTSLWAHFLTAFPVFQRIFGPPQTRTIPTVIKHWHVCPHIATPGGQEHYGFLMDRP